MPGFFVLQVDRRALTAALGATLLLAYGWLRAGAAEPDLPAMASYLAGRTVVIDPGHGGPDPGTMARSGLLEKDVVLAVSLRLRRLLEDAGTRVVLTRATDADLSGTPDASYRERWRRAHRRRAEIANASGADVLVSVHANAVGSPRWFGAQTFHRADAGEDSRRLAHYVQRELRHVTGGTDRTISTHIQHYLLNHAQMPAVTVELGFLSNPREAELLALGAYQERLAWAVFVGLAHYFADLPAAKEATP